MSDTPSSRRTQLQEDTYFRVLRMLQVLLLLFPPLLQRVMNCDSSHADGCCGGSAQHQLLDQRRLRLLLRAQAAAAGGGGRRAQRLQSGRRA